MKHSVTTSTVLVWVLAGIGWYWWKDAMAGLYAAMGLGLLGVLAPRWLRPLAAGWQWLGETIGRVMSVWILTLIFYLLVWPLGIWTRWRGLGMRLSAPEDTNFKPVSTNISPRDFEKTW